MCVISFPFFFPVIIMLYFNFFFSFFFKKKDFNSCYCRCTCCSSCNLGSRIAIYWTKRCLGHFIRQVYFPPPSLFFCVHYLTLTLLRKIGLTGVFLFASTTARNSNALLGWNCGYTFSSNVGIIFIVSFHVNISDLPIIYIYIYIPFI